MDSKSNESVIDPSAMPLTKLLASAPHRLLFLGGTIVVLLSMSWWALELISIRFGLQGWPQPSVPPGWGHAMLMQYGLFPPFMFGFLLTVFPRWLDRPALPKSRYLPVAGAVFGGYVLANIGLLAMPHLLLAGLLLMLLGYVVGAWILGSVLLASSKSVDHARSCWLAVMVGVLGMAAFVAFLLGAPADFGTLAIKLGTFGVLLPIFFSVTHRMLPFFSGSVLAGYEVIRPRWSLLVVWPLLLVHASLEWRGLLGWLWLVDLPLLGIFVWHAIAWQPWKAMRPGLLAVLHLACAWLPVAFALYAAQDLFYAIDGRVVLGRAPLHALAIGYFGSTMVAMVTRVTMGHSGRPLQMGAVAWLCFALLQIVALIRVGAELSSDSWTWFVVAACGWLLAFAPWVLRSAWIYLTPRVDGKPG